MSDESGFVTGSRVGHCQQQQHPLASLASSVQGIHSALAGRPVQSRASLPSPRQQQQLSSRQPSGSEFSLQNPLTPSSPSVAMPQHPGNDSRRTSRTAGLVFATVPGASNILASMEEQPLLLLSDTVGPVSKHRQLPQIRDQVHRRLERPLLLQVRHIFAGTAARTLAQAFIHPLDTIKTRLQVSDRLIDGNSHADVL